MMLTSPRGPQQFENRFHCHAKLAQRLFKMKRRWWRKFFWEAHIRLASQ